VAFASHCPHSEFRAHQKAPVAFKPEEFFNQPRMDDMNSLCDIPKQRPSFRKGVSIWLTVVALWFVIMAANDFKSVATVVFPLVLIFATYLAIRFSFPQKS